MSTSKAVVSIVIVAALVGIGFVTGAFKAEYDLTHAKPVPVQVLGVYACGQLWGIVVSDSKGALYAATPHSEGSAAVVAAAKSLQPSARSTVTLEIPCHAPDSSADHR